MRVISIGDLVADYYYKNDKLIGINGGMTSHNIIANLAKMNISTAVFGVCGNDVQGKIAIKSLEKIKVDISGIKVFDNFRTRCFHVSYFDENGKLSFTSKKRCPKCNNKKWYDESLINPKEIQKNIKEDDILVFDNLNNHNQEIIDNIKNKKVIDLGQYFEFDNLTNQQIIKKIANKFEIINFNERVAKYLLNRFEYKNNTELYKLFKPKLITITHGEKGATFIYNNVEYKYTLKDKGVVVDSTGAGDAFVASIIKDCIKNNFNYDIGLFEKWYENTNKLTKKVVAKMGARGHLYSLFKIREKKEVCTCEDCSFIERKTIKRCNININNLETRIINAINSTATTNINKIIFNGDNNYLFIGTGGSFAGANYASKVINTLYGSNTYAMYPRDVIYRNNKNINKVFLFSYSGTTNDVLNCVKSIDKRNIYLITKGDKLKIIEKTPILKNNIISYRTSSNKSKERGFLSFEGAVVPAALFLNHYLNVTNNPIEITKFIKESLQEWNIKIEQLISKDIIQTIKKHNNINIFRGDFTDSACFDLESKIIESGITNCIIHEKKNFSHGRFINYENLNNNYSFYFKQKTTSKYEKELLNYLGKNNLIIESKYDGLLAEFDLLIAAQFIIYHIGKTLDIDVSKPDYSETALKIYFYKGDL